MLRWASRRQSAALGGREERAGAASRPGIVARGREPRWHVSRQRGQAPRVRTRADAVASATGTAVNGGVMPPRELNQGRRQPGGDQRGHSHVAAELRWAPGLAAGRGEDRKGDEAVRISLDVAPGTPGRASRSPPELLL